MKGALFGAAIATLALAGCDGPSLSQNQRDEVQDIADDATEDNSARLDELESRVSELESR